MSIIIRFVSPALLALCLLGPSGCDDSEASSKTDAAPNSADPASSKDADDKEAALDPMVVEAVEATNADMAEVRKGLAKGSLSESMVCSDILRRVPTVEKADPELAAKAKQLCDYERPMAELEATVKAVEDELAENPAKPGRKRMIVACSSSTASQAEKTMEEAKTLDDDASKLLAKYDELCAS